MKIKDKVKQQIVKQMLKVLPNVSDKNLIRLTYFAEKLTKVSKNEVRSFRKLIKQKHPALALAKKILKQLSPNCRDKLLTNLLLNFLLFSHDRRNEFFNKHGFMPPWFLLISPTMKCNLNCVGCSTRSYSDKEDLDFEIIDRVFTEAKELGMYFVVTLGGETFTRKDIFDIFKKHSDMYFLVYTNGTLITEEVAKKLGELANVTLAFSVEGFEQETDKRRGKGVFKKIINAMEICRKYGILFGVSVTATKFNNDLICSDKFIDFFIKNGAYYAWYFQYIPIGSKPDVNLMPTPEQRVKLRKRAIEIRNTKPFFVGDFWNDGPFVSGCLAGGRKYLHINHKGDVEPCGFVHFAVDNIKNKPLKQVLNSDFFKTIRKNQRGIKNLLTPCMIIDNPWLLRQACKMCNAKPTHLGAETIIKDQKIVKHLDNYSKRIHELSDDVWGEERYKKWKERWDAKRKDEY